MAIMEYAYLLWMKRRSEIRSKRQIKEGMVIKDLKKLSSGVSKKNLDQIGELCSLNQTSNALELASYSYKVDTIAQCVSMVSFVLFNAVYWTYY